MTAVREVREDSAAATANAPAALIPFDLYICIYISFSAVSTNVDRSAGQQAPRARTLRGILIINISAPRLAATRIGPVSA